MATYLPNITDYIPHIQPFKPDYNFYQKALETKQAQYKAGHDKISNLYGTLLNSEMLREPNIEKRDKFFQQIQNDIQRMSSVDLSLEENVNTAYQVFQPLIDDKNIARDMAWTKNYRNEKQKAEYFRNCLSKECMGKYWKGGDEYLDYMAQDFSKSDDETAMRFQSPRYVPYVNVNERANQILKEYAPNVERVSFQGGYIFKTKNGEPITDELKYYLRGILGNDSQINDIYDVKSTLARKRFISANAERLGGEEAAEAEYLNQMLADSKSESTKNYNGAAQILANLGVSSAAYVEYLKRHGYNPVADKEKVIKIEKAKEETDLLNAVLATYKEKSELVENTEDLDRETLRRRVDGMVSSVLFDNDILGAARSYAILHSEVDVQVSPYALKAYEAKLNFKYGAAMEEIKSILRKKEEEYQNPLNYIIDPVSGYTHNSDPTASVSALQEETMDQVVGSYSDQVIQYLRTSYEQLSAAASDTRDPNRASLAKRALKMYGPNVDKAGNLIADFGKTEDFFREESPYYYQTLYTKMVAENKKHGDLYYSDSKNILNMLTAAESTITNTANVFRYYDEDIIHNNEAVVTGMMDKHKGEEFIDLAPFLLKPNGHTRNHGQFLRAVYENASEGYRDTEEFYEQAGDAWKHLSELFIDNLNNNKNLDIRNVNLPGMIISGGGGVGANPVGWNTDMWDPNSVGSLNSANVLAVDFPKAIATLVGDNHTKDELEDADMVNPVTDLIQLYKNEIFRGNYKKRGVEPPRGLMNIQPVAADSRDRMAYTITFDPVWLESISHRTKNGMEGPASFLWDNTNKRWKNGGKVTFYLDPKDATSQPAQAIFSPISPETVEMRQKGYVGINSYPQGGNVKIKKSGEGYIVSGTYFNAVDGKLVPVPLPPKYQSFQNLHTAVTVMKNNLQQAQTSNQEALDLYKYSQGTISYEDLLKQLNQGR